MRTLCLCLKHPLSQDLHHHHTHNQANCFPSKPTSNTLSSVRTALDLQPSLHSSPWIPRAACSLFLPHSWTHIVPGAYGSKCPPWSSSRSLLGTCRAPPASPASAHTSPSIFVHCVLPATGPFNVFYHPLLAWLSLQTSAQTHFLQEVWPDLPAWVQCLLTTSKHPIPFLAFIMTT